LDSGQSSAQKDLDSFCRGVRHAHFLVVFVPNFFHISAPPRWLSGMSIGKRKKTVEVANYRFENVRSNRYFYRLFATKKARLDAWRAGIGHQMSETR
jgi:trans-aconitate methyltransferase